MSSKPKIIPTWRLNDMSPTWKKHVALQNGVNETPRNKPSLEKDEPSEPRNTVVEHAGEASPSGNIRGTSASRPVLKLPTCAHDHTSVAKLGEAAAAKWLESQGFTLIARNWRSGRFCEIDLIMRDPNYLLTVIEVKTRKCSGDGELTNANWAGFDAINWSKRRKILIAARSYMAVMRLRDQSCRVDAVVVTYTTTYIKNGQRYFNGVRIMHVPGAFSDV